MVSFWGFMEGLPRTAPEGEPVLHEVGSGGTRRPGGVGTRDTWTRSSLRTTHPDDTPASTTGCLPRGVPVTCLPETVAFGGTRVSGR